MCWSNCCCSSPKTVSRFLIRISFGLSLVFLGITHFRQLSLFVAMAQKDLGFLSPLGTVWGYAYPALLVIGGLLFVIGMLPQVAVWATGLALASIPAGMLLKSALTGASLAETMPAAETAFIWIIVFLLVSKSTAWMCCNKACNTTDKNGCCSGASCCTPAASAPVKKSVSKA